MHGPRSATDQLMSTQRHAFPQQCPMQVTGDTVYNMLRLAEVECDDDERPLNPHKIKITEVFFFLQLLFYLLDSFMVSLI